MNYYDILGIRKYATLKEIKLAYRSKVKDLHPDRYSNENDKKIYTERLQKINYIYSVLSDDEQRIKYDLELAKYESYQYKEKEPTVDESSYKHHYEKASIISIIGAKIFYKIIAFIFAIVLYIIINLGLNIYQKTFLYKEEKVKLQILEKEINSLEQTIKHKKSKLEKNYQLDIKKEIIKNYEKELNLLKKEYDNSANVNFRAMVRKKYNFIHNSYKNEIDRYNMELQLYRKEYKDIDQDIVNYNNKINNYNKIAESIKYYQIVPGRRRK